MAKSLLRRRCIRPATPNPKPTTVRSTLPISPSPRRAKVEASGEFWSMLLGSKLWGSFPTADDATETLMTKKSTIAMIASTAITNDAIPIRECLSSRPAPPCSTPPYSIPSPRRSVPIRSHPQV